jgi:hypothetical protein
MGRIPVTMICFLLSGVCFFGSEGKLLNSSCLASLSVPIFFPVRVHRFLLCYTITKSFCLQQNEKSMPIKESAADRTRTMGQWGCHPHNPFFTLLLRVPRLWRISGPSSSLSSGNYPCLWRFLFRRCLSHRRTG